ncbi:MAG: opioid growth factor receptor-related protein [Verrucomicrobiota bacterium]
MAAAHPDSPVGDDPFLAFYRGSGRDACGRTLALIHAFDLGELESTHDFIQWLFPLREPSNFNPDAPLLTPPRIEAFHKDELLRANLLKSFDLMLGFYGLERAENNGAIGLQRASTYPQRKAEWVTPRNHNFLRLTRIMTSLKLLGHEHHGRALLAALEQIYQEEGAVIGATTLGFWRRAVE